MFQEEEQRTSTEANSDKEIIGKIPLVGVAGRIASGKGTVAKIIEEEFGFPNITLSNFLREEAQKRDIPHPYTREILIALWDEWQKKEGKDVLTNRALEKLTTDYQTSPFPGVTIDGFRHTEEAETFQKTPMAHFLWIETGEEKDDPMKRFERLKVRGRKGDAMSYEEFLQKDEFDASTVSAIRELVPDSNVIRNNSSEEELRKQVIYFMQNVVGLRPLKSK